MQHVLYVIQEFTGQKVSGLLTSLLLAAGLAILAGCSPGAGDPSDLKGVTTPGTTTGTTPGTTTGTTPGTSSTPETASAPTMTLALTNAAGATVSSIAMEAPATVRATLKDAAGAVIPNAVVTFGTDAALARIAPAPTALTNASGVATITLKPATNQAVGAATVTAAAKVGTIDVIGAIGFAIESTAIAGEPTSAPTLSLTLTTAAGAPVTSISIGAPATVKGTLRDAAGAAVPNTVMSFTTDSALATISPAATALTDANGVATVTLNTATIQAAGAGVLRANAQIGTISVAGSIGYAVGVAFVTVTAPALGVGISPLSAFGTTSVSATVSIGGAPVATPQVVTFSSSCASVGKAILTSGVATVGGVATGSYRDNGCAGTDFISATAAGVTSPSTSLVVAAPTTGSIQFVSATPSSISLRGIGGTEAAQVRFKVLDTGGNPLSGKTVTFGLSTTVGGITLTPPGTPVPPAPAPTAISDAGGLVVITVNSGTVSTPVRVTASTPGATAGTTLTTQSSGLTITTGIPDQDSFSLSATKLNPEFLRIDGNTTVLTARLADHFNNPVPDGTVVNFTAEGGSIVASCSTVTDSDGNSNCSTTLTSQAPRPADGRVTVLAYAVGEESFIDLNGNGVADAPDELFDLNGRSSDMPEAFRDDNENDVRDDKETFIDFNQNGVYDGPDRKFSGVLCDSGRSSPGTCSATRSIHVRAKLAIIFSGSEAFVTIISPPDTIRLSGDCSGTSRRIDLRIVDELGNPMPVGTTIVITTTKGTISGISSFTQVNTNVTPAPGTANYSVSIRDNSVLTSTLNPVTGVTETTCVDPSPSGVLTVTVTTPGIPSVPGIKTTVQVPVLN